MRELPRPILPLARLLVLTLGLLGLVAAPTGFGTGSGAQTGNSATGTISAVRTWVAQHTPTRGRASAKPHPGGHAQTAATGGTVATAPTRQVAAPDAPEAKPAPAALPLPGTDVRPPSVRAIRPPPAAGAAPDLAAGGAPRGRAPPASTRT
ncbi:hypothetical protein [Actinomadura sp. 7K534]|uniref:hypothetical protein n=1 Tax=Actinomadura sp. 7K534 TaxID=2530366 RepID=UPI00105013B1|nr:hypothetical protein [Actinomadura sp. 7K534]TDB96513.1 hypothetical protein E1266_09435 [Actinomadura sp. 7K534]